MRGNVLQILRDPREAGKLVDEINATIGQRLHSEMHRTGVPIYPRMYPKIAAIAVLNDVSRDELRVETQVLIGTRDRPQDAYTFGNQYASRTCFARGEDPPMSKVLDLVVYPAVLQALKRHAERHDDF